MKKLAIEKVLHNKVNGEELKALIKQSNEARITFSFYKYHHIGNPQVLRDHLFILWHQLRALGRVYVSYEGINAQMSVPEANWERFKSDLESITFLQGIRLNIAVEDDGKSFFKLKVKVRQKIVADGLNDESFDVTNIGVHLNAEEFNKVTDDPEAIIVDMRNHYESEVGHFENAWRPDVDTFRDALPVVLKELEDKKDKPIVMYCTGGIRCEKASAFLKHHQFSKVYQLEGGIIKYAQDAKAKGLKNKFLGKNFVFDERLGERISDQVIARCHQCGNLCDTHVNCKNEACNLLFIQCSSCAEAMEGCCSEECREVIHLPVEQQAELRKQKDAGIRIFSKGRFKRFQTQE
jgi:UPF0176 protein